MEPRTGDVAVCPLCGYREGTEPESPLHLPARTELHGQYLVGRVLGHGGFGITYLGWDLNLERKVAIKEYLPSGVAVRTVRDSEVIPFSGDMRKDFEYGLERYLDEARVVAKFQTHPSIVTVLNFFRDNGTAYLVMEYLEGTTFERYLEKQGGKTSIDTVMTVMVPVLEALGAVHQSGILHRDISPDNIYITRKWQVKVLDFGAARYALGQKSRNLSVILKEGYAPMEQYQSKGNQGPWTDSYACGATIYRALTGKIPPSSLDRMQTDELQPPSELGVELSKAQEAAILKSMAVTPANRFQTMADFRDALTGVAAPISHPPIRLDQDISTPPASQAEVVTVRSGTPLQPPSPTLPVGHANVATHQTPVSQPPQPQPAERVTRPSEKPPKPSMPKWVWAASAGVLLAVFAIGGYKQYEEKQRLAELQRQEEIKKRQFDEELKKQRAQAVEEERRHAENEKQLAILKAQQDEIDRKQKELEEQRIALERSKQQGSNRQQGNTKQQSSQGNTSQQQILQQQQIYQQQQEALRRELERKQQEQAQAEAQRIRQQQQQQQQGSNTKQQQLIPPVGSTFDDAMRQSRAAMNARNYPAATQFAQQAIKANPARPDGYSQLGWIAIYGIGDMQLAQQSYKDAIARGGVVWFRVNHDHANGSYQFRCTGDLGIARDHVEFQAQGGEHNFRLANSAIAEAKGNSALRRLVGASNDFHIHSTDGRRFNLVSVSNPKPIREMILSLMGAK
ncbi:MAG: protein kinase [Acidobacteria bacterium]|nr:protein kinase [Acidobacteriota bacterium]